MILSCDFSSFSLFVWLLFSCSVVSDSLWPHGPQHTRLPCPSPSPRGCSDSCPLGKWCHPPSHSLSSPSPLAFILSGSFPVSWLFASGGQNIGVSASTSVLPMNIQGWFLLGLTGLISLLSKGLSRVFSHTTIQKYQLQVAEIFLLALFSIGPTWKHW